MYAIIWISGRARLMPRAMEPPIRPSPIKAMVVSVICSMGFSFLYAGVCLKIASCRDDLKLPAGQLGVGGQIVHEGFECVESQGLGAV